MTAVILEERHGLPQAKELVYSSNLMQRRGVKSSRSLR